MSVRHFICVLVIVLGPAAALFSFGARGEIVVEEAAETSSPYAAFTGSERIPSVVYVIPDDHGSALATLDESGHPSFTLMLPGYGLPYRPAAESGGVQVPRRTAQQASAEAAFAARRMRQRKRIPLFSVSPHFVPLATPGGHFLYPPLAADPSGRRSNSENAAYSAQRAARQRFQR